LYAPAGPCLLSCEIAIENLIQKPPNFTKNKATNLVFIKDRAENSKAAQKSGFDGILFTRRNSCRKN